VTFVFVFRPKMNAHFRFRFVFGRKWNIIFVGFSFTAENEKNAFRSASIATSQKVTVLVLKLRS